MIELKLVRTNVFTRWECTVCGGYTNKDSVLIEACGYLRVCPLCLKTGNIDERLENHAAFVEGKAEYIRSFIGQLKLPTFAEWEVEEQKANDEWLAGLSPEERAAEKTAIDAIAARPARGRTPQPRITRRPWTRDA
jgi:hypothetical protein